MTRTKLVRMYLEDEVAWLDETARLIRLRRFAEIDRKHLVEYLQDMALRERREVLSRLVGLMAHLLKKELQPWMETASWQSSIKVHRTHLQDLLESKTLRNHAEEVLEKAYLRSVDQAASDTGMAPKQFPSECPFTVEGLLEDDVPNDG